MPNVLKEKSLLFSYPSSSIHIRLTDSVIYCFPEASTRHCTDQITSNFLTHASWRLYEIGQSSTCLCTTSILLSNTTIGTFRQVIRGDIQQIPLERNSAGVSNRQTQTHRHSHLNLTFQDTSSNISKKRWYWFDLKETSLFIQRRNSLVGLKEKSLLFSRKNDIDLIFPHQRSRTLFAVTTGLSRCPPTWKEKYFPTHNNLASKYANVP